MIVVTGSTGHVGRLVAERLAEAGEPCACWHAIRVAPAFADAEIVRGDYADSDSLATALGRGDRVFMVSLHEGHGLRIPVHACSPYPPGREPGC